jgi:amino acid transporter
MLVLGLAAALVQILGGPSRGLLVAARQGGNLPPALQRENARGMPVSIILLQATISSVLALGYHLLGSVENAWFMFSLVQTNMTLLLYLLLFASVVACRRLRPDGVRPFRIPGGWLGLVVVLGVGACVCLLGLTLSLFPTDDAEGLPLWAYELALIGGTVGFAVLPLVFRMFRKPSWQTEPEVDAAHTPEAAEV